MKTFTRTVYLQCAHRDVRVGRKYRNVYTYAINSANSLLTDRLARVTVMAGQPSTFYSSNETLIIGSTWFRLHAFGQQLEESYAKDV